MSKARTIKNNHAMGVRCKVNETAGFEIFYLCAISMNQQEWLPASAFDVVQAHAIDIKELAKRWMMLLRIGRLSPSNQRHRAEQSGSQRRRNCIFPRIQG
jgi:hypothetical protein